MKKPKDRPPKIIDNIKCYSPELAFSNKFISPKLFKYYAGAIENNFWYQVRNDLIEYLFKKYLREDLGKDVLEVGCGTCYVLNRLSSSQPRHSFTGMDVYLEPLKFAQKRFPGISLIQGDITKVTDFIGEYSAVGMFDILEHVERDLLLLKQVRKTLKPDGLLFLSVPQHPFLWSSVDKMNMHKRRYNRTELLTKLKEAGYDVLFISSFSFSIFPFLLISRFLDKLTPGTDGSARENTIVDRELNIHPYLNLLFGYLLKIDLCLINMGFSLPFGGSLFTVASPFPPGRTSVTFRKALSQIHVKPCKLQSKPVD